MRATVNGIQIAYTDEGQGLPILFLHDFPLSRGAWSKQVDEFKTRFRVIAPDLPGFGESEAASGPISVNRLAEDLHALMEHLVTGPVILAGHAMGGLVALAFASAFPRFLRGLVLVGMTASQESPEVEKQVANLRVPILVIAGSEDALVPPSESEALARLIPGAQLNLIPRAGHLVAIEQPAAFNEVVRNWLAWGSNGRYPNALQPARELARMA
jgi:pimeloyl-ACP methyl ester carboxylesterase